MSTEQNASNTTAPTQFLQASNEKYAFRRFGSGRVLRLLLLQHFTVTLDNWDPAVTDPLASGREVILFESAGLGRSTGKVPDTIAGMATRAFALLDALDLRSCDVLGFSLGGMVAQQMAEDRPSIFRRMILVVTALPESGCTSVTADLRELKRDQYPSHCRQQPLTPRNAARANIRERGWVCGRLGVGGYRDIRLPHVNHSPPNPESSHHAMHDCHTEDYAGRYGDQRRNS